MGILGLSTSMELTSEVAGRDGGMGWLLRPGLCVDGDDNFSAYGDDHEEYGCPFAVAPSAELLSTQWRGCYSPSELTCQTAVPPTPTAEKVGLSG